MTRKILLVSAAITLLIGYKFRPPPTTVTRIIDGDTIVLNDNRRIRLIGIDTPEKDDCYYQKATEIASNLLLNQKIKLETDTDTLDNFGRTLAYVFLPDGTFINEYLLQNGTGEFFLDTQNVRYQPQLIKAAEKSHSDKSGLWSACAKSDKCDIKGNYDIRGHRFYHLPSFRHYPQVVINLDKGDRWFCTEESAQKAGFTKARE